MSALSCCDDSFFSRLPAVWRSGMQFLLSLFLLPDLHNAVMATTPFRMRHVWTCMCVWTQPSYLLFIFGVINSSFETFFEFFPLLPTLITSPPSLPLRSLSLLHSSPLLPLCHFYEEKCEPIFGNQESLFIPPRKVGAEKGGRKGGSEAAMKRGERKRRPQFEASTAPKGAVEGEGR